MDIYFSWIFKIDWLLLCKPCILMLFWDCTPWDWKLFEVYEQLRCWKVWSRSTSSPNCWDWKKLVVDWSAGLICRSCEVARFLCWLCDLWLIMDFPMASSRNKGHYLRMRMAYMDETWWSPWKMVSYESSCKSSWIASSDGLNHLVSVRILPTGMWWFFESCFCKIFDISQGSDPKDLIQCVL